MRLKNVFQPLFHWTATYLPGLFTKWARRRFKSKSTVIVSRTKLNIISLHVCVYVNFKKQLKYVILKFIVI